MGQLGPHIGAQWRLNAHACAHAICRCARHMRRSTSAVLHACTHRTPTSARIVLTTRATCPIDGACGPHIGAQWRLNAHECAHSICRRARHMRRGTSAVLHACTYRTPTSARIVLTNRAPCHTLVCAGNGNARTTSHRHALGRADNGNARTTRNARCVAKHILRAGTGTIDAPALPLHRRHIVMH